MIIFVHVILHVAGKTRPTPRIISSTTFDPTRDKVLLSNGKKSSQ